MRIPNTLTALILSASLIVSAASAAPGSSQNQAACTTQSQQQTPNCAVTPGGPRTPAQTGNGQSQSRQGQGQTDQVQARQQNAPDRRAPASTQQNVGRDAARVSRVDVYVDGRKVLDNVSRQQVSQLRLARGRHQVVVVPHGQPVGKAVSSAVYTQNAPGSVSVSFGNDFSVTLR